MNLLGRDCILMRSTDRFIANKNLSRARLITSIRKSIRFVNELLASVIVLGSAHNSRPFLIVVQCH